VNIGTVCSGEPG
jgi:hypothetical protein